MIPFESWEKSSKEGDRKRRRESVKELRRLGRFRDRPPSATSRRKSTTWVLQPSLPAQKDRLCLPTSRIRLPIPRCYRRAFQISPELNLLQQFNINHLSTTTGSVKIIDAVTQRIEKKTLSYLWDAAGAWQELGRQTKTAAPSQQRYLRTFVILQTSSSGPCYSAYCRCRFLKYKKKSLYDVTKLN